MTPLAIRVAAIGVIVVVGLPGLASTAQAAQFLQGNLIGYSESKLTVFQSQDTDRLFDIDLTELTVRDSHGSVVKHVTTGSQVMLQASIVSYRSIGSEPVYAVFEVRDPDSATDYAAWQITTIGSAEQITVNTSWVAPDRPGEYEVRVFIITCPNCLGVVHPILNYRLIVTQA